MQIVFQNYVDIHNWLLEIEAARKNKEKKKKIEKNKAPTKGKIRQQIKKKDVVQEI